MANVIPEHFSNVPVRVTQLPRAPSAQLADVGQGEQARALAGLGGVVAEIGQGRQQAKDDLSIATAINELNAYVFTESTALQTRQFTSPDEFAKAEDEFKKSRRLEAKRIAASQNQDVAARLNEYALNSEVRDRKSYHSVIFGKQQRFNVAELNRLWGEKFQQFIGNPAELKSELTTLVEQYRPWLNPAYAQKLTSSIDTEIANFQRQKLLDTYHDTAQILPFDEAITFLNNVKGIESAERNDLITRRKRQNEIATASRNDKVYWDTLIQATKDPQSVTDDDLDALIKPNSLTLDDAKAIRKERDTDSPLKTPRAQLYYNRLDAVYPNRDDDEDEAYEWDIANEKLTQFFESTKNPTASQAKEVFQEITADKKSGLFDFLLNPFGRETPASRLAGEIGKAGRRLGETKTFKFTAINPETGERMGSNDGIEWQKIP